MKNTYNPDVAYTSYVNKKPPFLIKYIKYDFNINPYHSKIYCFTPDETIKSLLDALDITEMWDCNAKDISLFTFNFHNNSFSDKIPISIKSINDAYDNFKTNIISLKPLIISRLIERHSKLYKNKKPTKISKLPKLWRYWNEQLINACYDGDLKRVKHCLNKGADIHAPLMSETYGDPWINSYPIKDAPLRISINLENLPIIDFLMKNGAVIYDDENTNALEQKLRKLKIKHL